MSAALHSPAHRAVALALLAAAGIAAGSLLVQGRGRTVEYVYAVLDPACVAAISVGLLLRQVKQSRWIVPLLLQGVILNVATHPHTPQLTAIGFAAGVLASLAVVCSLYRVAIVGTLVCCSSIAASLLVGLLSQGSS